MKKRLTISLALGVFLAVSGWSQSTLLYTGTFASPYDENLSDQHTVVTLQLWGNPGDKAQEQVSYSFLGSTAEVNTVRIDFGSTLKATWSVSVMDPIELVSYSGFGQTTWVPSGPFTVQSAYENMTGNIISSLPTPPLGYTVTMGLLGGGTAIPTTASSTSVQSGSWDFGTPWANTSTGTWWATFTEATNLAPMFAYDQSLATPLLTTSTGTYLPSKMVQLELVKNNAINVHLDPASLSGNTVQTTLTSLAGPSPSQPTWQTLNLWVNGLLVPPTALTSSGVVTNGNIQKETLSWNYTAGDTDQLQVVDNVGNTQSIWYSSTKSDIVEPKVANGDLVLKPDGTVWNWGGTGSISPDVIAGHFPIEASGLTGVVSIVAGGYMADALKSDGTVWAWGLNIMGEGEWIRGLPISSYIPVQVSGLSDITSIAYGTPMVALKSDGTVWVWGTSNSVPTQVTDLTGVVSIAGGLYDSAAVKSDGTVWAWGLNADEQLGNNSFTNSSVPVQVTGLTNVVSVAVGNNFIVALKSDGTVWAWGNNQYDQLGSNTVVMRSPVPLQVTGLSGIISISASYNDYLALALKSDGTVWAWGSGQLGVNNIGESNLPVQVTGLTNVESIAPNGFPMALKSDGTVWEWGQGPVLKAPLGLVPPSYSYVPFQLPLPSLDATPPTFTIANPSTSANQTWTATGVVMTDGQSGVNPAACLASIDGNPATVFTVNSGSITLDTHLFGDGQHTVNLSVSDNADNTTTLNFNFVIDRNGPTIIVASAPVFATSTWTASGVTIFDVLSGVNASSQIAWFDSTTPVSPMPFTLSNGSFSIDVSALAPSANHTIYLQAANNVGVAATVSYAFAVDRTAPTIAATVPVGTNSLSLSLSGVTLIDTQSGVNAGTATWWLDSPTPVTPAALTLTSGATTLPLPANLTQAAHTLYLSVADNVGNVAIQAFPFVYDTTPPSLTATVPQYSTRSLTLSNIVVTDAGSGPAPNLLAWFDSATPMGAYSVTPLAGSAVVSVPSGLPDGPHTLYLQGSDLAGNTTVVLYPFNLDTTPPTVSATVAPYANASLALTNVVFIDEMSGPSGTLLAWFDTRTPPSNPTSLTITSGSASISTAGLSATTHTLYLEGFDLAGNVQIQSYSFVVDRTPPTLLAAVGAYVNGTNTLAVTATLSDSAGITSLSASIDGTASALPTAGGALSLSVSPSLIDGTHSVILIAVDEVGNVTVSAAYSFIVDRTPPVLSAQVSAWANASLAGTNLSFTDATSGPVTSSLVYWFDSGTRPTSPSALVVAGDGTFSVSTSALSEAVHTLSVQGFDKAGNSVVTSWSFTVTRQVPVLTDCGVTENGNPVGIADYLQGGSDLVMPVWTDAAPVQFRLVVNQTGTTPQSETDWSEGTHATWSSNPVDISTWVSGSLSYLYVQGLDAAGNISTVTERVIQVDNGTPGTTIIRSTTFPYANSVDDAIAQTVGLFQLSVSSTGPEGLKDYKWSFFQASSAPNPDTDSPLQSGTTATSITLTNLADNGQGQFYWLAARAVGGNGKPGAWALFVFRVDTTPPAALTVTSSTNALSTLAYQGSQIAFQWNQPTDMTGVKSFYYKEDLLGIGQSWSPKTTLDASWTATSQSSIVVGGLTGSGQVGLSVAAEDWSGNVVYAYRLAQYDNVKPTWDPTDTRTLSAVPDPTNRTATLNWRNAVDDVSSVGNGLIYGVEVQDITSQPYVEISHWQYLAALPTSMQTTFSGLVPGDSYLINVALVDGAGNQQVFPLAFQEIDPNAQVVPPYTVSFQQNWGGFTVLGQTAYTGVNITGQTAVLELASSPLSALPITNPVATTWTLPNLSPSGPNWSSTPIALSDPNATMTWSANGVSGPVVGVSFDSSGLTLGSMALILPLTNSQGTTGQGVTFSNVLVGPAPNYAFISSNKATVPAGTTFTTSDGWTLSNLQGLSLSQAGWTLNASLAIPTGALLISSDAQGSQPIALTLSPGAYIQGTSVAQAPVSVPTTGLYVTAGGLTIQVIHATIIGGRLSIAQGYAVVPGLSSTTALELDDVTVDTQGNISQGSAFASHLTGMITTPYGTLSASTNAFLIQGGQLVLSQSVLTRADTSTITLTGSVFDSTGLTQNGGTVVGAFSGTYFGFPVHATGGTIAKGVRNFTSASIDLPVFGVTALPLQGLGVSLTNDALVTAGVSSQGVAIATAYGASGVQATSLTLSPQGVSASLVATLPTAWSSALLPLGSRTLSSTGVIGGDSGSAYPSLNYQGFSFAPQSVGLTSLGLVFNELTLGPFSPITSAGPQFAGLTLLADGTVVQAGTASQPLVDNVSYQNSQGQNVSWALNFAALRVGQDGLEGEPTVVLPASLGGQPFVLGTTTLKSDGSILNQPSTAGASVTVYGWASTALSVSLVGPDYQLNGVDVKLPGIMQSSDLSIDSVLIDSIGNLVSSQSASQAVFTGTNGFQVQGTNIRFAPQGLVMGGQVNLPASLGGAGVTVPDGAITLASDGAVLVSTAVSSFSVNSEGWSLQVPSLQIDENGMTITGATVSPLGLATLSLPTIKVDASGELTSTADVLTSGSFSLPGNSITVSYSDVRFASDGVHLSASVSLPQTWGGAGLSFGDLRVSPSGQISADASLANVSVPLPSLGMTASFASLRLSDSEFQLNGVQLAFTSGTMKGQTLTVDSATLDFAGNLNLHGFSFGSFNLWGYQVTLTGLQVGPSSIGFTGSIQLPTTLPIPELAGLVLNLNAFQVGFDGSVQAFNVSIAQGLSLTLFNSWTVAVQGLEINQNILSVTQATLQLPSGFLVNSVAVSGMSIDVSSGAIQWGAMRVAGLSYAWNGLSFQLTSLTVDPTNGLLFAGQVQIPQNAPNGTPYPVLLQNTTVQVSELQIKPDGTLGTVNAALTGINGPLFDSAVLLSNASFGFDDSSGQLQFRFTGNVKLGASFPPGLAGLTLNINALSFNASDGSFGDLNVSYQPPAQTPPVSLFGTMAFSPTSVVLTKTGASAFEVAIGGNFVTGPSLPGALANLNVAVQNFTLNSEGTILAFNASMPIPDQSNLINGLTLNGGTLGVDYETTPSPSLAYTVSGSVGLGSSFPEGLAGLSLAINTFKWTGNGNLLAMNISTSWSGDRTLFEAADVQNGSIGLSGTSASSWNINVTGTLVLPNSLPQGLAGMKINIGTLNFDTSGNINQANIAIQNVNTQIFGTVNLVGGSLSVSSYDGNALRIDVGGALVLPSTMGSVFGGLSVNVSQFAFTTAGQVLAINGTLGVPTTMPLFAGITATGSQVQFSQAGLSLSGTVNIPSNLMGNLPSGIVIQQLLVGWDGSIKALDAGILQWTAQLAGFSTNIQNLVLSTSGISIQSAVMTLPANLGNQQISITNAGFTTSGQFTGTIGVGEVDQTIAGFTLRLHNLSVNIAAKSLNVGVAQISTPSIGTLNASIQLNSLTISPSGITLGGIGFTLPDFNYGGVGFRSVSVSFSVDGSTFDIAGGGQAMLAGLGTLDAQLSFTTISSTYPIGLQRAYFSYTMYPGIALGTTGLFLNQISGGFAYGPPNEVPSDLQPLFDSTGPRLQLGLGLYAVNPSMLSMNADFWVDVKNGAWAFEGNATVLGGLMTGRLAAGFGNNIFYGTYQFNIRFVNGQVQIWIFPYQGNTVMSGDGNVTFVIPKGFIADWSVDLGWLGSYSVEIPGSDWGLGVDAEFGQFSSGQGVKGYLNLPVLGNVGGFIDSGGLHFNISNYTLVKPAGY